MPDQKIDGVTCKNHITPETKEEIQTRLQSKEADKARKLLAQAMSHFQAQRIVKDHITKQVIKDGLARK